MLREATEELLEIKVREDETLWGGGVQPRGCQGSGPHE